MGSSLARREERGRGKEGGYGRGRGSIDGAGRRGIGRRGDEGSGVGLSPYYAESPEPILGASSPCLGRVLSLGLGEGDRADA